MSVSVLLGEKKKLVLECKACCLLSVLLPIGLQHQGIFRVSGSQVEVNDIKNSFERGNCVSPHRQAC